MSMIDTIKVLNAMVDDGIIGSYAIGGAVAAYNYVEPAVTEDLDILVSFDNPGPKASSGLVTLSPIFSYLKKRGYTRHEKEEIVIADWRVQFLPVADNLDAEALREATSIDVRIGKKSVRARVLSAEHVVATALKVGRPKDLLRIAQFVEHKAVDFSRLCRVIKSHGLHPKWTGFCRRTGISNPCA